MTTDIYQGSRSATLALVDDALGACNHVYEAAIADSDEGLIDWSCYQPISRAIGDLRELHVRIDQSVRT